MPIMLSWEAIIFGTCLVTAAVIWTIGLTLTEELRDSGASFAAALQNTRDQSLIDFMSVLYWSVPFILPICLVITLQTHGPLPGLKAIGALSISVYICALLRIIIGWPQIYWARHSARGLTCLVDWGLPSQTLAPLTAVILYFAWQMRESVRVGLLAPLMYLIAQFLVETYLGFSDYFTSLMSVSLGATLAIGLRAIDGSFDKVFSYVVENKAKGLAWMTACFFLSIGVTFAVYEGRSPYLDGDWKDQLDDVCDDADEVSLNAACFTTSVIIALFFGATTGCIVSHTLVKELWWSDLRTRWLRILITVAYIYLGFAVVFVVSIVKQSIRESSSNSFIYFIVEDRYGYFTYSYSLITSYILGLTLTGVLPMVCHLCFNHKRDPLSIQINSR